MSRERILFLCVANSVRSQMAEGLARAFHGDRVEVQSAGSHPGGVHPVAVQVLAELDIDIAGADSTAVDDVDPSTVDTVITLCAEEVCPVFLGQARRLHWPLPDPGFVGGGDVMEGFRQVRESLRERLVQHLGPESQKP